MDNNKNPDKSSVYKLLQLQAIEAKLTDSVDFFERKVRRWYSKTFHTPLHETYKLRWDMILLHYYENALEEQNYNDVFDMACQEYIPEFMQAEEEAAQKFAKALEAEQKQTLVNKKKNENNASKKGQSSRNEVSKEQTDSGNPEQAPEPVEMDLNFDDEDT